MVNLRDYKAYWERVVARVPEITGLLPVTIDDRMGKKIQSLPSASVTLFMFPPLAEADGRTVDSYREKNHCVIFLMAKYDPQRRSSYDLLEQTQPIAESIKMMLLDDYAAGCPILKLDPHSIETAPETELYGCFAGWSMTFNLFSD